MQFEKGVHSSSRDLNVGTSGVGCIGLAAQGS